MARLKHVVGVGTCLQRACYVNMGEWGAASGASCSPPTGPDRASTSWCITPTPTPAASPTSSTSPTRTQARLYNEALQTIIAMVNNLRGAGYAYDIFLGSGFAFHPGSHYVNQDLVQQDFKEWLEGQLERQTIRCGGVIDLRTTTAQEGADPGNLVSRTDKATVHIIDRSLTDENGYTDKTVIFGIQTGVKAPFWGKTG